MARTVLRNALTVVLGGWLVVAAAASVAADEAEAKQTAQAPKPKLICTKEHVTGSMIPVRRCRTVEQMQGEQKASAEYLRSLNDAQSGRVISDKPGLGSANQ